jgi:hypothetical protein
MSKFSTTLSIVLKHWPIVTDENDQLVRNLATAFAMAGTSEEEIIEICGQLSEFKDAAFNRGLSAKAEYH